MCVIFVFLGKYLSRYFTLNNDDFVVIEKHTETDVFRWKYYDKIYTVNFWLIITKRPLAVQIYAKKYKFIFSKPA